MSPSAAAAATAHWITAETAPPVFISLRFSEAMVEGRALQKGLLERGIASFLCDIPAGQDLADAVVTALAHCDLAVILGTTTYGARTKSGFSTFEELRYIFEVGKPYFMVKMCNGFEEAEAEFRLPAGTTAAHWRPTNKDEREQLPPGLLDKLILQLESVTGGALSYPQTSTKEEARRPSMPPASSRGRPAALRPWLASLGLSQCAAVLLEMGAVDALDVHYGVLGGEITLKHLLSRGIKRRKAAVLLREAKQLSPL